MVTKDDSEAAKKIWKDVAQAARNVPAWVKLHVLESAHELANEISGRK